jgi:hypothetical protein
VPAHHAGGVIPSTDACLSTGSFANTRSSARPSACCVQATSRALWGNQLHPQPLPSSGPPLVAPLIFPCVHRRNRLWVVACPADGHVTPVPREYDTSSLVNAEFTPSMKPSVTSYEYALPAVPIST